LRHVEPLGRPTEVALLGDGDEVAQQTGIHIRSIWALVILETSTR
jgi:hypothetical protein